MKLVYQLIIPRMRIKSEANSSESYWSKSKRHQRQKKMVKAYLLQERPIIGLPVYIHLTRIAPRFFDAHDNLPSSMKWIVDAIAEYIIPGKKPGRADDSKEINWIYNQEKGKPKEYSLRIEIFKDE